mgnify:CR=1 FL=1
MMGEIILTIVGIAFLIVLCVGGVSFSFKDQLTMGSLGGPKKKDPK